MSTKKKIELEAGVRAALAVLPSAANLGKQDGIAHMKHGLKAAGADRQEGNG